MPRTHFSILQELSYGLIAPMEAQGYTQPERLVPDISEGRMFSQWLRERGVDPRTLRTSIATKMVALSTLGYIRTRCSPTFAHTSTRYGCQHGVRRILRARLLAPRRRA